MGARKNKHRRHSDDDHEHAVHHDESNWLVSYADMMTLLFGFFVLMYSLSRFDNTRFDLVRKEVAKYFGGNIKEISTILEAEQKLKTVLLGSGEMKGVEISKGSDNTLQLKFEGNVLFESGATELKEAAKPSLRQVVAALRSVPSVEKISVEGHTDADPMQNTVIRSNWELSALRASSVVRYFEESGLSSNVLAAVGFGSSHPIAAEKDAQGHSLETGKAANRRVVVQVKLLDPEEAYRLQQQQFKKQLNKEEIERQKKETELQDKMKLAKARFDEAQRKYREQSEQKRKEQQLQKLEKQIQALENKTKQYEEKAQ
ncbi:OmpA family protein [Bdellovibrio sp. HCB288]|uniref:OmpA/MotB family protein n=1 Tax=Bdellovibrio sp. HCB288 TaxID=3394355 RepID=UPI0039B5D0E4